MTHSQEEAFIIMTLGPVFGGIVFFLVMDIIDDIKEYLENR